jgi:hypothetical protein
MDEHDGWHLQSKEKKISNGIFGFATHFFLMVNFHKPHI